MIVGDRVEGKFQVTVFGSIVSLVGLFSFLVGLISLIKPLRFLRIRNRKQAGLIMGISLLVMILGGTIQRAADQPGNEDVDGGPTTTAPKLPGVGDPVRDGKFEFTVLRIEQPGSVYNPDDGIGDKARGEWFIVHMTLTNIGDTAQSFFANDQKALWQNREFTADGSTFNGTDFLSDLNPGVGVDLVVMFDVPIGWPEDGEGVVLELHDSGFSSGVNVYL